MIKNNKLYHTDGIYEEGEDDPEDFLPCIPFTPEEFDEKYDWVHKNSLEDDENQTEVAQFVIDHSRMVIDNIKNHNHESGQIFNYIYEDMNFTPATGMFITEKYKVFFFEGDIVLFFMK